MSQWTHVNASIRFDSMLGFGQPTEKELGRICRWEDEDDSHWDNPDLPCGSEGSIEYRIIITGSKSSIASRAVIFTGDLRDYSDLDEILAYFEKITEGKIIRSGVLEVSIEYQHVYVYRFDNDKEKWIQVSKENSI